VYPNSHNDTKAYIQTQEKLKVSNLLTVTERQAQNNHP